jgi:hypothetical protein
MIFRTRLDGPTTHSTAGSRRGAWETDDVSRLGAAVEVEGSNPPKRPPSCAYKASRRSPVLLEHLFFRTQLVCPSLLFCNLLISSCG